MLKQKFEEIEKRLKGVETLKDGIIDFVTDTVSGINDTVSKEIKELIENMKGAFDTAIEHLKLDFASQMEEARERINTLSQELEELRQSMSEVVGDLTATPDILGDVEEYLKEIQRTDPDLFADRVAMIRHMSDFVAKHGFGEDWFVFYKKIKFQ